MKSYTKPTLTTNDNFGFESIYTSSGEPYHTCCGCHGQDAASYMSFYQVHCLNCSNLLENGYCRYGKNSGTPRR